MDSTEFTLWWIARVVLWTVIGAAAWLCFRRTRIRSFLSLGGLLVLWPWFEMLVWALYRHFLNAVMAGRRPWLFPFTRLVSGFHGWRRGELPPGMFVTKLNASMEIFQLLLFAIVLIFFALSFRKAAGGRGFTVVVRSSASESPNTSGTSSKHD